MKKILLYIIGIVVLSFITWFFIQDSKVSVYGATSPEDRTLFSEATNNKIAWDVEGGHGIYTANNFFQLMRYQNKLFKIAKDRNMSSFSTTIDGVFIAQWLD